MMQVKFKKWWHWFSPSHRRQRRIVQAILDARIREINKSYYDKRVLNLIMSMKRPIALWNGMWTK